MGFWKDFINETVETAVAGITAGATKGLLGEKTDLGTGLTEGTQSDFDKYVTARQAAVKGEYDKYTKKFDAFEEQAKQFADLVGSPSQQNLDTELDGMEVAARFMQGKSQSQIQDAIKKLQAIRDEGGNVREKISDLVKRGSGEEVRNYTAQDIARMQLGGGFKYTPKPYDISKRRTGMARFLRDDLGLFGETFAKEREDLAERQASQITNALPGFAKYSAQGTSPYSKAQANISFSGLDLRTEAQLRAEQKSKYDLEGSKLQVERTQQAINNARSQEERAVSQEKRQVAESEARLRNYGLEQDINEINLEKAKLARRQNQTKLHGRHADLLSQGKYSEAEGVMRTINRNAAIFGTEDEVDAYVQQRISEDPTFKKAYKAGVGGVGAEGYTPKQRKAMIGAFRVRGMVATMQKIADGGNVDALRALSNNGFGTLDFSEKNVADMKAFVAIREFAKQEDNDLEKGIDAFLQYQGIQVTEENRASVIKEYNRVGKYIGSSMAGDNTGGSGGSGGSGGDTTKTQTTPQPQNNLDKRVRDSLGSKTPKPVIKEQGSGKRSVELPEKERNKAIRASTILMQNQADAQEKLKRFQKLLGEVNRIKQQNPNGVESYLNKLNLGITSERQLMRSIGNLVRQDREYDRRLDDIRDKYGSMLQGYEGVPQRILPNQR